MNGWGVWALSIHDNVSKNFSDEAEDLNPHYLAKSNFTKQLLKDLKLFPIWGNIFSPRFKFGRVPASSSSVESEMNILKTHFMAKYKNKLVRVDEFVADHAEHLKGKSLLVSSDLQDGIDCLDKVPIAVECTVCSTCLTSKDDLVQCSLCDSVCHKKFCIFHEDFNICQTCYKIDFTQKLIAMNEIEDWGGLGRPKKKQTSEKN